MSDDRKAKYAEAITKAWYDGDNDVDAVMAVADAELAQQWWEHEADLRAAYGAARETADDMTLAVQTLQAALAVALGQVARVEALVREYEPEGGWVSIRRLRAAMTVPAPTDK